MKYIFMNKKSSQSVDIIVSIFPRRFTRKRDMIDQVEREQ